MSSNSYAVKARKFVISNPDSPASDGQRKQIGRLLRFKAVDVETGNYLVEALELPMTRFEADREIKRLALCPNVAKAAVSPTKAVEIAEKAVEHSQKPNKAVAARAIEKIAREHGIKLGKVAHNHLAAIS